MTQLTKGEVIAIDGKTIRRALERGQKGAIHMVSAWATQNRLVLGQRKVSAKSNEITAIPELLKILTMVGSIVSIDAMGCQKAVRPRVGERRKGTRTKTGKELNINFIIEVWGWAQMTWEVIISETSRNRSSGRSSWRRLAWVRIPMR